MERKYQETSSILIIFWLFELNEKEIEQLFNKSINETTSIDWVLTRLFFKARYVIALYIEPESM